MKSRKDCKQRSKQTRQRTHGDDLQRALHWIVTDDIFAQVRLHGNVKWLPVALVRLAIFWVWSPEPGLVEAAKAAIATVVKLFGSVAVRSYQALTGALMQYTGQLLPLLWVRLHDLMEQCGRTGEWRIGKWLPL